MNHEDLETRLRQLGVVKGTRNLKPTRETADFPPPNQQTQPPSSVAGQQNTRLESLIPGGQVVETAEGGCFVVDKVYPLTHRHGMDRFEIARGVSLQTAVPYCQEPRFRGLLLQDCAFLDTETTGLAGAGTLAFMVGVAFFERGAGGDVLVARQYFLRDHGDEPAMLLLLDELVQQKAAVVTFNGRSFDLPLLDKRYLLNRSYSHLLSLPHLDLLPPSRRLWRTRIGSCALRHLEENLLLVQRTEEDVPGFMIPGLYVDYLQNNDAREMTRVFYHNQIDILSMVTLAGRLLAQLQQVDPGDHPIDIFSLGRWQMELGLLPEGEQNLRRAMVGDLPLAVYHETLYRLAEYLKRNGRRPEAIHLWQQIAATTFTDVTAHIELAKHYEWHEENLPLAIQWTKGAISLIDRWGSPNLKQWRPDLEHRLTRLQTKSDGCQPVP